MSQRDLLELHGEENIPAGGVLIIPNRLSFQDLLHLEKYFQGRKVAYLFDREFTYDPPLRGRIEKSGTAIIEFSSNEEAKDSFKKVLHQHLGEDGLAIFVPGIVKVNPAQIMTVPSAVLRFLTSSGAPVLPLFIDHPEETCLRVESRSDIERVVFSFGSLLQREAANLANYTENFLIASETAFSARPILKSHLAWEILKGLKRCGKSAEIFDGNDDSSLPYDRLLAAAMVLSRAIRKATQKKRVAIILPPGKAGILANLGVLFAGKVPVNLNFTAGERAIKSCIEQANLDCFISAQRFMKRCSSFPWPEDGKMMLLDRILPGWKVQIGLCYALSKLLPTPMLARILGIPREGGHEEAVLLFTSGSSGDPKGVVLSHRNLLANVNQFGARIDLHPYDKVLGCLPLFHSFGCAVTMWYPLLEGISVVTYPNPLDTGKLAELIEQHSVRLLLATPTFLRGYLRKATKEQLAPLKLVITGAEKLPPAIAEAFEERFGKCVLEGYGLTETSPVTNVNLPDVGEANDPCCPVLPNHRFGSVGLLIPGMAVRITDPDTQEPLPLHHRGIIWFRGANVFEGYLDQPEKTRDVIKNGWFRTGDLGRLDEDGFLYIEGRLSRFSKIGGEMVPHETVENLINQAMRHSEDERVIAVTGVPDEAKGEALVLLSTDPDADINQLRSRLTEEGIPALWIPKKVIFVEKIPILASGKLDIKACEEIARNDRS